MVVQKPISVCDVSASSCTRDPTGLSSLPPGSIAAAVVEHETRLHLPHHHDEDFV